LKSREREWKEEKERKKKVYDRDERKVSGV